VLGLVLCGCASAGGTTLNSEVGEEFQLAPAQTIAVGRDGLTVRFIGVTEDSRCPANVQCIRAGEARVQLELRFPGNEPDEVILATEGAQPRHASLGPYDVQLVRLDPTPRTDVPHPHYLATLKAVRH
jgi:hypothetical protein